MCAPSVMETVRQRAVAAGVCRRDGRVRAGGVDAGGGAAEGRPAARRIPRRRRSDASIFAVAAGVSRLQACADSPAIDHRAERIREQRSDVRRAHRHPCRRAVAFRRRRDVGRSSSSRSSDRPARRHRYRRSRGARTPTPSSPSTISCNGRSATAACRPARSWRCMPGGMRGQRAPIDF